MLNYILQVILFQVLFLAIYDLFLSKETFFTKNRWYLLSTPILSFLIPLIKIPTFQKAVPQELIVFLPEVVLSPEKIMQQTFQYSFIQSSLNIFTILFWIGFAVCSSIFLIKLVKIINLIQKNETIKKSNFTLILLPKVSKAFSFFRYIFLGKEIPKNQQEKVIEHELVHSKQNHSIDLIFFEFLKIIMWFNPMIYFYQRRITLVHEYISDAIVAKSEEKETYINNLLSNFFQVENISFVNQFYKKSLIRKRILMINKNKSKKISQLKYLVLIPVLVSMLFYSSCSTNKIELEKKLQTNYRIADGQLFSFKGNKETFIDSYYGKDPKGFLEEIPFDELPEIIKEKELTKVKHFKEMYKNNKQLQTIIKPSRFFRTPNGRIAIGTIGESFTSIHPDKVGDELLFTRVANSPRFPGCKERDSDCFLEKLEEHFQNNFDKNVLVNLNTETKKVKINIEFNINTKGIVDNIKIKAPIALIEKEAEKAIKSLPKMNSGEKYGKPINTKYILPFTILI